MITFLRRCSLQNTDQVMSFWFFSQPLKVDCLSYLFYCLCQSPEEGKMSSVQFKIFNGDNFERCRIHRMKKERFELITYQKFACEVLKTKGSFLEGKTPREVRIRYTDNEDTFVNVSCDDNLIVACRCLRPLDNSEDFYRLSVNVHATATAVQAGQQIELKGRL